MTARYCQIRVKCMVCGLHFIVCTDEPEIHSAMTLHCPECGQHKGAFLVHHAVVEGFIFQAVPGSAPLTSLGPDDTRLTMAEAAEAEAQHAEQLAASRAHVEERERLIRGEMSE